MLSRFCSVAPAGAIVAMVLILSGQARAEGDPQHGKRLFLYCAACHTLHASEPDKVGPNLHGVVGAPAGSRGSFAYSAALKDAGITWTPENLDAWVKQPTALVPGTKMAFAGLPKDQDRADIISYLQQETK